MRKNGGVNALPQVKHVLAEKKDMVVNRPNSLGRLPVMRLESIWKRETPED